MSTTLPAAEVFDPAFAPVAHPTACPPWCADRAHPAGHHFGPSMTAHYSPQQRLTVADCGGLEVLLRVELTRTDEGDAQGETVLYLTESGSELDVAGVDMLIADAQAWVEKLRVLRRQMGA